MSFRLNFILQCLSSMAWAVMNWGLFKIIYRHTGEIGLDSGWHEHEFFIFLGTIWIINSLIQTLFMANAAEFSELIRTGNLDFALLKPIDTQFLISFPRINWSQLPNGILGGMLIAHSLRELMQEREIYFSVFSIPAFLFFIGCGAVVMYSVMICLASTSIWFGRNQNLYNFWFYITNFYRYPHGNLSAQWRRYGTVGDVHFRRPHISCIQHSSSNFGSAFGDAVEIMGMGISSLCNHRLSLEPDGKSLGI